MSDLYHSLKVGCDSLVKGHGDARNRLRNGNARSLRLDAHPRHIFVEVHALELGCMCFWAAASGGGAATATAAAAAAAALSWRTPVEDIKSCGATPSAI
jgi:hypothetical protein